MVWKMRDLRSGDWEIRKYCENQIRGTQHRTPEMIFHLTERGGEVRPPPNYVRGESPREWVGNNGNSRCKDTWPEGGVELSCGEKSKTLANTTKHLLSFLAFCFVWTFPNLKMPPWGGGRGNNQRFQTRHFCSCLIFWNVVSAFAVPPVAPLCLQARRFWSVCCRWNSLWQSHGPANFPGMFNKASGAEGTVEFAAVTAIYKLWTEHAADDIDLETYHQGCCSLTFSLAARRGSSIRAKSEMCQCQAGQRCLHSHPDRAGVRGSIRKLPGVLGMLGFPWGCFYCNLRGIIRNIFLLTRKSSHRAPPAISEHPFRHTHACADSRLVPQMNWGQNVWVGVSCSPCQSRAGLWLLCCPQPAQTASKGTKWN